MGRGRDKFTRYEFFINLMIKCFKLIPKWIRQKLFMWFNKMNGYIGMTFRYALLKTLAKSCGRNVSIHPYVHIFNIENLTIGNNVSIHPMCYIECGINMNEGIYIGNDVSIAHGVSIIATTHIYDNLTIPIKDQGINEESISICDNVWIGAKATILYGKTLNSGSIVGANSVVTQDVEKDTIVGGIPARVLRIRE